MQKMSLESVHKVCSWLDEFDEDVELDDSDVSDAVPQFHTRLMYLTCVIIIVILVKPIIITSEHEFYLSKEEKTKWYKNFLTNKTKQRAYNIITQRPGVNAVAKNVTSILDYWKLLLFK